MGILSATTAEIHILHYSAVNKQTVCLTSDAIASTLWNESY